jgi:cell division septation protein DedD
VARYAQDDGFHEIQLNGKQLVFVFMAATVVSVVIFLCGVLVGRGVRAERATAMADASSSAPVATPSVPPPQPAPAAPGSDPTVAAPPPAAEDLSYFNRLEKKGQPAETLKPASEKPAPSADRAARETAKAEKSAAPAPVPARPAPEPKESPRKPSPEALQAAQTVPNEPSGSGFALQITALRERGEAETIAKRLSAKGYAAYVMRPPAGTPAVYRVRVGKFKTRHEAEAIAARLQKEEQFTPWITR